MREVCPSCGAAITEEKCPYCGIMFYDFSAIDMDEPFFMKVKIRNKIHNLKVRATSIDVNYPINESVCYADNSEVYRQSVVFPELTLNCVVLSENGIRDIVLDTDITGEYGEDIVSGVYK